MSDDQALDPRWFQFSSSRPPQTDTQTLLRLLKHAEAAVRWHAAEELFYSQDPAAVDALTEVLRNDTKFSVREMAAQALGAMFQAGIPVPIFAAAVKPDADTRMSLVIERLHELGVKVIVEETQFKLHVPHELKVPVAMEVGFLMAQLMH
ncbi:MAG: HEAT repeat domain-containing protein, partial [Burkholderiales bacterium]|nr:HEAT repeat domain-containing protein [Anaerolineae bacterium]